MDLADLRRLDLAGLECLFRDAPLGPAPAGWYDGTFLAQIDARPMVVALDALMFRAPRFGVCFDRRAWTFGSPRLAVGHFRVERGPSRFRATDVLQLHYDVSRLPRFVRAVLYDEVKPLSDELCLGLGAIDDVPGRGDHFYFALAKPS